MPKQQPDAGHPIPFVGLRLHENRTTTGRRTSTPARRAAHYVAYGRDQQGQLEANQRGRWLGPDGRTHDHNLVMAWAKAEGLRHRYTCQAVLSVQQGALTAADFGRALAQGGEISQWRLMVHHDTDYHHAHVLFFRDQRMDKETFLAWQADIRAELSRLEQQQLARSRAAEQDLELELSAGRERAQSWGLE